MDTPVTIELDDELRALQARWRSERSRAAQDELYAREIAPRLLPRFCALPLHGAPAGMPRPTALVSILGLSWQPVSSPATCSCSARRSRSARTRV
jgi:hypothetical protein